MKRSVILLFFWGLVSLTSYANYEILFGKQYSNLPTSTLKTTSKVENICLEGSEFLMSKPIVSCTAEYVKLFQHKQSYLSPSNLIRLGCEKGGSATFKLSSRGVTYPKFFVLSVCYASAAADFNFNGSNVSVDKSIFVDKLVAPSDTAELTSFVFSSAAMVTIYLKSIAVYDTIPVPVVAQQVNGLSMTVPEFPDARVLYSITKSKDEAPVDFDEYASPVELKGCTDGPGTYYVWAKSDLGQSIVSEPEVVHTFDYTGKADEEAVPYRKVLDNIELQDGYWYIVGAQQGDSFVALGNDGVGAEINLTDDGFYAYHSQLNGKVLEFEYKEGQLLTESKLTFSRAGDNNATVSVNNGVASIEINGSKLGYDRENNRFDNNGEQTELVLLSSDGSRNTGFISTVMDNADKVEYYNLQGMKVDSPSSGLFIKRQGASIVKVLVR